MGELLASMAQNVWVIHELPMWSDKDLGNMDLQPCLHVGFPLGQPSCFSERGERYTEPYLMEDPRTRVPGVYSTKCSPGFQRLLEHNL